MFFDQSDSFKLFFGRSPNDHFYEFILNSDHLVSENPDKPQPLVAMFFAYQVHFRCIYKESSGDHSCDVTWPCVQELSFKVNGCQCMMHD